MDLSETYNQIRTNICGLRRIQKTFKQDIKGKHNIILHPCGANPPKTRLALFILNKIKTSWRRVLNGWSQGSRWIALEWWAKVP